MTLDDLFYVFAFCLWGGAMYCLGVYRRERPKRPPNLRVVRGDDDETRSMTRRKW